jgi:ubiquinone/menaquinone biosynthesis C-methylase UbiE
VTSRFDPVAEAYDAGRPSYPPELYDAIEQLAQRPLMGADVLDVGAGTGIATRALRERGARVIAIDHGQRMLARLRAHSPDVEVVRADGHSLPIRDASIDLVTYAQAFHWTDPARSVPEALRVLRSQGALVLWWNITERSRSPWLAAHEKRLAEACPEFEEFAAPDLSGFPLDVEAVRLPWSRRISLDVFLASLRSKSYVQALGTPEADCFVAQERVRLERDLGITDDGHMVEEPFTIQLFVCRMRQ